jgi:putative FmdB family regulatory protein
MALKIFDFKCSSCEHIYEKMVSDSCYNPDCPKCGGESERMLTFSGYANATNSDEPRTQEDLQNYFGNGQYRPGYKKSEWKRTKN